MKLGGHQRPATTVLECEPQPYAADVQIIGPDGGLFHVGPHPDRLRGDEMPLSAQIIGIVDVYDALTSTRSYRAAMSHERALDELRSMSASWHPDV